MLNPNYLFFLLPIPIALFISGFITVFYSFYISGKFMRLRNKALMSFPKDQLITEQMVQAEFLRQNPEYINFTISRVFGIVFLICLILSFIIATLVWFSSPVPVRMFN